jgi:hypothetical protein
VLNRAGYYSEPTASNVAVALLAAKINQDSASPDYLTQDLSSVYVNADSRAYPLSSYSYIILPTAKEFGFTEDKGLTLADFGAYFLCEGQQQAETLGYSPLPVNLVLAGQAQIEKIPGGDPAIKGIAQCHNPTLDPSDPNGNALAKKAPLPPDCDKKGAVQCTAGTGGAKNLPADQTANASDPEGADGAAGPGGTGGESSGDDTGQGTAGVPGGTDSALVAEGGDGRVNMAAASPQTIPAGASLGIAAAALVAGAGVLGVAVLPPLLGKRAARRSRLASTRLGATGRAGS